MSAGIGKCLECGQNNSYVATACWACGARLPWSEAAERTLGAAAQQTEEQMAGASEIGTEPITPYAESTGSLVRTPYPPDPNDTSFALPQVPSTGAAIAGGYQCCGLHIDGDMNFCPKCGRALKPPQEWSEAAAWRTPVVREPSAVELDKTVDKPSWGYNVLSFLFPFVGVIFFFVMRARMPVRARAALLCAGLSILFNIVYYIATGTDPSTIFSIR